MFNFKIFDYNIWPLFNDTFQYNGIILSFFINVTVKIFGKVLM